MKKVTVKDMIENSSMPGKLIRSTIDQFGGFDQFKEQVNDVYNHGITGGFSGFIYYVDTVDFYKRNKKDILMFSMGESEEIDTDMIEMFSGFGCMKDLDISKREIEEAVIFGKGEMVEQILNCLAWYIAESVCRLYVDLEMGE